MTEPVPTPSEDNVQDFTEVEVALIAFVKICWSKKTFNAILAECLANTAFQGKMKKALEGCTSIPAELKNITAAKVMAIIMAATTELAA